jgi:hypothetical protein
MNANVPSTAQGAAGANPATASAAPASAPNALTHFTIIESLAPGSVGKTYATDANGKVEKKVVAWIREGRATTREATPDNLEAALKQTTESSNKVLVLSSFNGATSGSPGAIEVVTRNELGYLLSKNKIGVVPGQGYYNVGKRDIFSAHGIFSARLKELMTPSDWILIDADSPPDMPDEWKQLTLAERLERLEAILPGISKCLRIEYRGSSARVIKGPGAQNPGPTHALIQISDPDMIDVLRLYVRIETVVAGLSFKSRRYSRKEPGKVIGHMHLTLCDWSVWVVARLIFNAKPDVSKAPGYRVLDADVKIVNRNGGVLDISWIKPPDADKLKDYRAKTGLDIRLDTSGGGNRLAVHEYGHLQLDTEIEAVGADKPLGDWLVKMLDRDIDKLRCQAPFRASTSKAAFIRIADSGEVFVYDAGTATNSYLDALPQTEEEAGARAASLEEFETLRVVLDARTRRTQRRAKTVFTALTDEEVEAATERARRLEGPTVDEVKKAADELKSRDMEGAKAVFDQLVRARSRTAADNDIVVDAVRRALGKAVTVKSVRALLKDAKARLARLRATEVKDGDLDSEADEKGGPPAGFRVIDGWMCRRIEDKDDD